MGFKGNSRLQKRSRAKTIDSEKIWTDLNTENFENFNEVLNMNITFSAQSKIKDESEMVPCLPQNNELKNTDLQKIDVINLDSRSFFNLNPTKPNNNSEKQNLMNETFSSPFYNMKVARVKSGKRITQKDYFLKRPTNYLLNTMDNEVKA